MAIGEVRLLAGWLENGRKGGVIPVECGGNHSYGGGYGWSQNEDLGKMNPFGRLDRPKVACWCLKTAQMAAMTVETSCKNIIVSG